MRTRLSLLTLLACVFGIAVPAHADLDAYLKKPEPVYKWEKKGEQKMDGCTVYDLHLVSQTWQGIVWEHRLQIFRPDKVDYPNFCTVYNTGGGGSDTNTRMGVKLAKDSGAMYAILFNIPNQPLYGGKTEDALIVYTWLQYLQTGDESWPLHFPMAKAVLKAMDAIQAFSKQEGLPAINDFLVHGASKRGWTTWLCGASRDPRIKAIAPMVIDVLNVPAQTKHQLDAYGKPSEQIGDYTSVNFQELLKTPGGKKLMQLEDPYSYLDRLTLPKLILLGTNDRYWTVDSLNLYWDDLKGPKWVLYAPNSGHGLEDRERVFNTLTAFIRMIAGHGKWPQPRWNYQDSPAGAELTIRSDMPAKEGRLFHVAAPTQDFRDSKWTFEAMQKNNGRLQGSWAEPKEGYAAIYGESVYEIDGRTFTLSTQMHVLGKKKAESK